MSGSSLNFLVVLWIDRGSNFLHLPLWFSDGPARSTGLRLSSNIVPSSDVQREAFERSLPQCHYAFVHSSPPMLESSHQFQPQLSVFEEVLAVQVGGETFLRIP